MQTSQFVYSKIPFVRIVIPFILGITLFHFFPRVPLFLSNSLIIFLFILLFLYQILPYLRSSYKWNPIWGGILFFLLVFIGYSLSNLQSQKKEIFHIDSNGIVMGDIYESPTEKERTVKTVVEIKAIRSNNEWISSDGRIILYFQKDSRTQNLKRGDRIIFEPFVQDVKNAGNPEEFDYKQYLAFHLISKQGYLKSENWKLIQSQAETGIYAFAENIREKLITILMKYGLNGENLGVASAISIGYKKELDDEIKQSYAATGATHILSVSGLHVGIIYVVLEFLFYFLSKKKYLRFLKALIIILFLWSYAVLTGLSPSVLRAATMFSFVVAGKAFDRNTNIYNTLAASAFALLILDPFILFEVGFQLSYLAVIGIVFFQPRVYKTVYLKNKWLDKIWILISVSIAAQIVTLPLCLYYFHQFPNYFIISGLIVVPLASVIIYLVIFLFVISPWEWAASWVGKGLNFLVEFMNSSIKTIENIPGALSSDISFNSIQLILFYTLLILLSLFILRKKILYFKLLLICLIGILVTGLINKVQTMNQRRIFVYNIHGVSAINFIDGPHNVLFSDIEKQNKNSLRSLKGNWLSLGVESERIIPFSQMKDQFLFTNLITIDNENLFFKKNFFNFYGCKIFNLRERINTNENHGKPLCIDYLILSNNINMTLQEVLLKFNPKTVIIDSSNSAWKTNNWIKEAKNCNMNYFAISQMGAFSVEI